MNISVPGVPGTGGRGKVLGGEDSVGLLLGGFRVAREAASAGRGCLRRELRAARVTLFAGYVGSLPSGINSECKHRAGAQSCSERINNSDSLCKALSKR